LESFSVQLDMIYPFTLMALPQRLYRPCKVSSYNHNKIGAVQRQGYGKQTCNFGISHLTTIYCNNSFPISIDPDHIFQY